MDTNSVTNNVISETNEIENINLPKKYATLMLNIISVVTKRGAFSPEEFKPIGELFEYLKKELKLDEK